jgi:cytochrome o ubiquinol oxidase subunit IV
MSEERSLKEMQKDWPQTLKLYLHGFIGSLLLTGASFLLAATQLLSTRVLIPALVFLALVQAAVQLIYFMHMGKEAKPRWMTVVFNFMVLVILIIVLGTLWIMSDLNHRVMPM